MVAQFRTHVFSLLIFPKYARLLRWDRAGVGITERIPIVEFTLAEFYWRYSRTTSAVRGHNTSAERVSDRVKAKRETLELDEKYKLFLWKLGENSYFVGKKTGMSSPTGRYMRTFRAFCEQGQKPVSLNDTWCVIIPGRLHVKKVRNIAQVKNRTDILTHKTITHEVAEMFPSRDFAKIRHYRLALGDVGRDLRAFSSVKTLVKAIHDAAIGNRMFLSRREQII